MNICTHYLAMVDQTDCGGVILCTISCESIVDEERISIKSGNYEHCMKKNYVGEDQDSRACGSCKNTLHCLYSTFNFLNFTCGPKCMQVL